jgi:DNA-binding HxlR family transcriptional regulator
MSTRFHWQSGTWKFHTNQLETMPEAKPSLPSANTEALVREILTRVADKWTLLVITTLEEEGELRFSRLRERVGGISQKMLTKTLRDLERDGLVTRRVHPVVPPRVDYRLTPLGESLGESVCGIWLWVEAHMQDVLRSRGSYDSRQ